MDAPSIPHIAAHAHASGHRNLQRRALLRGSRAPAHALVTQPRSPCTAEQSSSTRPGARRHTDAGQAAPCQAFVHACRSSAPLRPGAARQLAAVFPPSRPYSCKALLQGPGRDDPRTLEPTAHERSFYLWKCRREARQEPEALREGGEANATTYTRSCLQTQTQWHLRAPR